jgi:hypothetical protein
MCVASATLQWSHHSWGSRKMDKCTDLDMSSLKGSLTFKWRYEQSRYYVNLEEALAKSK